MVTIDPNKNPFPIWWPVKNTTPTTNEKSLIDHMAAEGVMALWEMASRCPCSTQTYSGANNLDCPTCFGKGWTYHHPQETKVEIQQNIRHQMLLERAGAWESGDILITMRAEHCPSFMDRITLLDSRMIVSKTMKRAVAKATLATDDAYEILPFPIVARSNVYRDSNNNNVTYTVDVIRIQAQDPTTLYAGEVLTRDVDFTVEFDSDGIGRLNWAVGDLLEDSITPDLDGLFSITYITRPVYRVMEYIHTVRDTTSFEKNAAGQHLAMPVQFKASLDADLRDGYGGVTE